MNHPAHPLEHSSAPPRISTEYVEFFNAKEVARRYAKKFNSRLDQLRHLNEVVILRSLVRGKMLDCSVGSGRFIRHFTSVSEFHAADTSLPFLESVKKKYPHVRTKQGDLRYPLDYATGEFDTVFSMRTLFAIGPIRGTLHEMARITKPGGTFIFDYPHVSRDKRSNDYDAVQTVKNEWIYLKRYQESPDVILDDMQGITYKKIPLDMFFHYIKAGSSTLSVATQARLTDKRRKLFARKRSLYQFFNSRWNIVPGRVWLLYERLSIKYPLLSFKPRGFVKCNRYLYICTKKADSTLRHTVMKS